MINERESLSHQFRGPKKDLGLWHLLEAINHQHHKEAFILLLAKAVSDVKNTRLNFSELYKTAQTYGPQLVAAM